MKELFLILTLVQVHVTGAQEAKVYRTDYIDTPINLDGNITEAAWSQVSWAEDFTQTDPMNGKPPAFDTRFKILYDSTYLYVAIRALDSHPDIR